MPTLPLKLFSPVPAAITEPNEPVEVDEPLTPVVVISAPLTPPATNDNTSAPLYPIPVSENWKCGCRSS